MLLLIASAAAIEPSWDCDSTASYPTLESMRGWYDALTDDPTIGLSSEFRSWRDAQLDASCVPVDCSFSYRELEAMGIEGTHECERYACVTAAGTAAASSTGRWETYDSSALELDEETEHWTVSLADGTRVTFQRDESYLWDIGWGTWWEYSETWSITWTGTPVSTIPGDQAIASSYTSWGDYFGAMSASARWSTDGCTVVAATEEDSETTDRTVSTATAEGMVSTEVMGCHLSPQGWLDSVFVGAVDGTTWALSTTDADVDGVVAANDCDDTDATISPCAEEIPADGIDQDCDGVDG